MNGKIEKKVRKLYAKDAHKNALAQANYLKSALKPCPRSRFLFPIWRYFARFYFTQNHIDAVTESYERLSK